MLRVQFDQLNDIALVRPEGRMYFGNSGVLPRIVDALLTRGVRSIVLNLCSLTSRDGSAISAALQCLHSVRRCGGDITLVDPVSSMGDVLTFTTLYLHFTVCDTEGDAIARLRTDSCASDVEEAASWSAVTATV